MVIHLGHTQQETQKVLQWQAETQSIIHCQASRENLTGENLKIQTMISIESVLLCTTNFLLPSPAIPLHPLQFCRVSSLVCLQQVFSVSNGSPSVVSQPLWGDYGVTYSIWETSLGSPGGYGPRLVGSQLPSGNN